jgi:hypothetical protein
MSATTAAAPPTATARGGGAMSSSLAPPRTSQAAEPVPAPAAPTARAFLTGYARILLVPLTALAALLTGWTAGHGTGPLLAAAAVVGWSVVVVVWLRRCGWPTATAHLAATAAPAVLLAPLAALGWLSAGGLVLWGPVSAVLAVALAAAHDPELVSLRSRAHRTR